MADRLIQQAIGLDVGDEVRDFLMTEGYDEEFGARPMRRAIQNHVDDTLADAILAGSLTGGQTANIVLTDGVVQVTALEQPAPQAA